MLTMELSDGGYGARTRENAAEADLTLAVAADFGTAGERLTAKAAREHGKPLVRVRHLAEGAEFDEAVAELVEALNGVWDVKGRPLVLNGAGNGVYTLGSQDQANEFALRLLGAAMGHPGRRFELGEVRSGGQSGYDVALVKAALDLGVPARVHAARSFGGRYLVRLEDGMDVGLTETEYRHGFDLRELEGG